MSQRFHGGFDRIWRHQDVAVVLGVNAGGTTAAQVAFLIAEPAIEHVEESAMPPVSGLLSLKLDYPNAFDRDCAALDGRLELGSDIFTHGGGRSIGCIAHGADAIKKLFVLVGEMGRENVEVVIAPSGPRGGTALPLPVDGPPRTLQLYALIREELRRLDD